MSTVTRLKCDACRREIDQASPAATEWWSLERVVRDGDDLHFCTIECVATWGNRRHLARSTA